MCQWATPRHSRGDAEALARLIADNREFLAPWEPVHAESYFTVEGQREILVRQLTDYSKDAMVPLAILDEAGELAGRINVSRITRGAFQSASLGYWVGQKQNGRGLATAAVTEAVAIAFGRVGLHRLEAGILLHNTPSQRVLARNGFTPFAIAPSYLKIDGRWQDHVLFHLLNDDVN